MEQFTREDLKLFCDELENFNIPEEFMLDYASYNDKVSKSFKLILESLVISLTNRSNSLFNLPQFKQFITLQENNILRSSSEPGIPELQLEIISVLIQLLDDIFEQQKSTELTEIITDLLSKHGIDIQLGDPNFVNTIAHILCIDINTIIPILYNSPSVKIFGGGNKYLRGGAEAADAADLTETELTETEPNETEELLNEQVAQFNETQVDIEEFREPSDTVRQEVFKTDKGSILLKAHKENERDRIRGDVVNKLQTEGKKLEKFKVTYHQNDIETLISTFANQMQLIINFIITYYTKKFLAQLNISILLKLLVDTIEDVKTNSDDDSFYKYEYNLIFIICMIIVSNYYRYGSTQNIDYTILEVLKINKSSYEHQYFDILDDLVKKMIKEYNYILSL